ncbi:hypothetical protein GH714_005084 [Hevea brasiliensis]|uniref:aspartyl aminopeptidase n=1 Tax=Hevea brasiliensis TaxID=3981 RepID=A0A6A6MYW9_HEVBR|nr:hypothetical protein GH714_005084 [Hevea brasiliensis]
MASAAANTPPPPPPSLFYVKSRPNPRVGDLLNYLNESWTQFHATAEAKRQLLAAGFHLLNENDEWDLKPGGRYFFTRNMSCLVAFSVGRNIWRWFMAHILFDRDLSVAGRVIVRGTDGSFLHKLVKVKKPLLRIPLAIHLDRTVNKDGFKPNLETHLIPLFATKPEETSTESKDKNTESSKAVHHPLLMQVLSDELSCSTDDVVSIELNLCDTQPSCLGGGNNEFIFSGRLDNLASSFCALRALIDSCKSSNDLSSEPAIRMAALFDNEEVGSGSVQGAGAPTMFQAMRRIVGCLAHNEVSEGAIERAIRKSFLVSADMAHGVHPNFMEKHEEHHRPEMRKGLVIKHNANLRYATNGITAFLFKEVGKILNLPTQEFVVRNDMGCGSTIGPILASGVGIRTVDCGIAQLSMHRICGGSRTDIEVRISVWIGVSLGELLLLLQLRQQSLILLV